MRRRKLRGWRMESSWSGVRRLFFFSSDAKCDPAHFYEYRYCNSGKYFYRYIYFFVIWTQVVHGSCMMPVDHFPPFLSKARDTGDYAINWKSKVRNVKESFKYATLPRENRYSGLYWVFNFIPIFLIYPVSFLNTEGLKPLLVILFFL
jgi:hypothetical protein